MLQQRFGFKRLKLPTVTDAFLQKTRRGFADSYAQQLAFAEEYQTQYGLYDHDNDNSRPLAVIALLPKEDGLRNDKLKQLIKRYRLHRINEKFNLSLEDFLQLPKNYIELLFEVCTEEANQRSPDLDKLADELKKAGMS